MRILAIDTAVEACSVAYGDGEGGVWARSQSMDRGHAECLFPLLEDLKAEIGWGPSSVPDRIVVTTGPGTFTGARVGLAGARAMALAWDVPCLGVSTLEALAASVPEPGVHVGAIDARRGQVYAQGFGPDGAPLAGPMAEAPEAVWQTLKKLVPGGVPVFLAGSGAGLLQAAAGDALSVTGPLAPDPGALLRFGRDDPAARPPRPLYLRAPDAKPPAPLPWALPS